MMMMMVSVVVIDPVVSDAAMGGYSAETGPRRSWPACHNELARSRRKWPAAKKWPFLKNQRHTEASGKCSKGLNCALSIETGLLTIC
jgi:hypothetical protein